VGRSRLAALTTSLLVLGGCYGAYQVSPDSVQTVGGLTPNVEDKDAGLVALAPGVAGALGFFGGDTKDHWKESFDDMARDLGKFLVRLSNGQAPGK